VGVNRTADLSETGLVKQRQRVDRRELDASINELADFVARSLRNLGVDDAHLDGTVQKVFLLALRQEGADGVLERGALFKAAARTAEQARKQWK
jgi:hypothetical protein